MNTALIVEGGAMRSVFSAGILDGFIERQFNPFQYYYGVSAGANNIATYIAGELGKSLEIYTELALDKEFINYSRFFKGGHLLNLDWLADKIFKTNKIMPSKVIKPNRPFFIVVTEVQTGKASYIQATTDNFKDLIKASASLPILYRDFPIINGKPVTDGGVADGIPLKKAIEHGAKRIMIIRSRHKTYQKRDSIYHKYLRWKLKKNTHLVKTMENRVQIYNETLGIINKPPEKISLLEICPPKDFPMGRFSRDIKTLKEGYYLGRNIANSTINQWNKLRNGN